MAPPAKSRKGKKAWRKNIDASEVEAFLEEETYQQRRGPAAKELKDDQLFFMDTSADVAGAEAVADGKRPAKRRREEAAARPLRAQQIIAEAHKAKPLTLAPPARKPTSTAGALLTTKNGLTATQITKPTRPTSGRMGGEQATDHPLDLWADEDLGLSGNAAAPGPSSTAALERQGKQQQQGAKKKARKAGASTPAATDPVAAAAAAVRAMGPTAKPLCGSPPPVRVKAVAVDIPGCSFNPDVEQHQDALAVLVAAEMRKELRKELLPAAPPEEVEAAEGRPLTELEALQVEADADDEEEAGGNEGPQGAGEVADPNAIDLAPGNGDEEEEESAGGGGASRKVVEKKTKKERKKEARRKVVELEAEERRRLKSQRRQLQSLREVQEQLQEEEQKKEIRRLRRAAMLAERATVEPPRLGKLKFEAPAVQVLTTDEKTGSLRQVVPCSMLAAERFKSLQQRGLLEPRKPQPFKERRRKVIYEKGARFERAEAASTEVRQMSRVNKKARRQAKAAAAKEDDEW